jgi:murein DD-endopeptidase MepM/ murein hydrolase activator NlpD
MSGLLMGRVVLLGWSWRRGLLYATAAIIVLPAVVAAGLLGATAPGADGPALVDPLPIRVVTQPFGCSDLILEPLTERCATRHFHSGLDLAAPLHTPVRAAHAGVVMSGVNRGGYGLFVLIDRDLAGDFSTLYAHLSVALVSSGDPVSAGQLIGLVGSTGNSTGPHLHFEVRLHNVPVDPAPYLPPPRPGGGG